MDKELKKMLEKLTTILEKEIKGKLIEKIKEAINEPCKISREKESGGKATTKIEGSILSILITLASLEKTVLEKLDPPAGLFEMLKEITGVTEDKENE